MESALHFTTYGPIALQIMAKMSHFSGLGGPNSQMRMGPCYYLSTIKCEI